MRQLCHRNQAVSNLLRAIPVIAIDLSALIALVKYKERLYTAKIILNHKFPRGVRFVMQRRFFLTSIGLGFLAGISLDLIMAIAKVASVSAKSSRTKAFYIATNGNDSWTGTEAKPFASLEKAQQAVRELRRTGLKQPVTVFLRGGTYYLPRPLTFTPQDSGTKDYPITYKAYPGEKPIISGGSVIKGNWQRQGNIYRLNLPKVKAGWFFRTLRVDNDWATRSRYPKLSNNEAENWLFAQSPAAVPLKQGNFEANIGRIHHRGDRLTWNITVAKSARYKIWMRYSNHMKPYGLENMSGRTSLQVEGKEPVLLDNLLDTGSFKTYSWQQVGLINLRAGKQKIIWENLKGGGLGLDAFVFTTDRHWNLAETFSTQNKELFEKALVQKGRQTILIHAETFANQQTKQMEVYPEPWRTQLTLKPEEFPDWQSWNGGEIEVFPDRCWVNAILPLQSKDSEIKTIFVSSKHDLKPGNRFCIRNTLAAVTRPNEWCLDRRTGNLHYYSQTNPAAKKLVAPRLGRLIVLQGNTKRKSFVRHLHFVDLTFQDTNYTLTKNYYLANDAAVWLSAAKQCSIRGCNFSYLGGYGIRLQQGSNNNRLAANTMTQLGQGGIIMWGDRRTQPYQNKVVNNQISYCGLVYKHVAGVYLVSGSNNLIAHNHISKMPRYAISLKSFSRDRYSHNNIVEFNRAIDTCLETSDTAAIETLGRDQQDSGNIIRYNFIRNVVGMVTNSQGEILSPYYTWGIYLDGYSSGTTIYGNIIVGTFYGGVMLHGGKNNTIQNNIFVNGSAGQIQISPKDSFMTGNVVSHNVFAYQQGDSKLWRSNNDWRTSALKVCDYNCYWCADSTNWIEQENLTPAGTMAQWRGLGYDTNSRRIKPPFWQVVQRDIGQIEPEDFQLAKNHNSFRNITFQPIPVDRIGIEQKT